MRCCKVDDVGSEPLTRPEGATRPFAAALSIGYKDAEAAVAARPQILMVRAGRGGLVPSYAVAGRRAFAVRINHTTPGTGELGAALITSSLAVEIGSTVHPRPTELNGTSADSSPP